MAGVSLVMYVLRKPCECTMVNMIKVKQGILSAYYKRCFKLYSGSYFYITFKSRFSSEKVNPGIGVNQTDLKSYHIIAFLSHWTSFHWCFPRFKHLS